ncbi:MAG: hypothetical protein Q9159_005865 [Coniocarpon cinnabarinum]
MTSTTGSPSQSPDHHDDAPRTKTGRISTAKKGKPVHKCDVEDCGKVYTRNEHLKREDHNIDPESGMPLENPVEHARTSERFSFEASSTSSIDPQREVSAYLLDDASMSPSPRMPLPPYGSADFAQMDFYQPYGFQAEANMFALPEGSMPEAPGGYSYDFSGSRSPVSAASSAQIWSQYNGDSRRPSRNPFSPASTEASLSPFSTPFGGSNVASNEMQDSSVEYFAAQDKCEDTIIQETLGNIIRAQDNYGFQPHLANVDARYMDAYWQCFDPLFSVVNRLNYENSGTSPLVKALMVAIGAYHLDYAPAQNLALALRETCSKLLHDRLILDYNHSRLCDLQATFLFEAFSVYCSRRPHSRFSQRFEDLLVGLHADRDNASYNNPLSMVDTSPVNYYNTNSSAQHMQWMHLESKRRLLLASYSLEVQQNLFLGSHRPVSDRNRPMPCSGALWSVKSFEEWHYLIQQESPEARTLPDAMMAARANEFNITDSFLSNVAVAHAAHSTMLDPAGSSTLSLQPSMHGAASRFTVEATTLAVNTPITNLLSVSGETFVLGQKLASSDQYHDACQELHSWVSSENAVPAVQAAIRLYSIALQGGRVGLIYEDWVLILAALVFWACAMWPDQNKIQSRPSPLPAHVVTDLTKKAIANASEQQGARGMSWGSARACLAYAKQQIEGRLGWLIQDSSGVLSKLVDGRAVDDISSSSESG